MEETIGYEALFSAEEWNELDLIEDEELELQFGSTSPDGELTETHDCTIYDPPGEYAGNESSFDIECDRCGTVGSAGIETEAKAIAMLHETFVATLVENWSVED